MCLYVFNLENWYFSLDQIVDQIVYLLVNFLATCRKILGMCVCTFWFVTVGTGSFPEVKRPGHRVNYPLPFIAEVEESV